MSKQCTASWDRAREYGLNESKKEHLCPACGKQIKLQDRPHWYGARIPAHNKPTNKKGEGMNGYQKFVSEVKEDDSWLCVRGNTGHFTCLMVSKIEFRRKTKTQIVVSEDGREKRYRLSDGRLVGGDYRSPGFPMPSTHEDIEEARAKIRILKLRREIKDLVGNRCLDEISDEFRLRQIKALLAEQIKGKA
jgi:hypothetical protein